jgi:hypothetical protein
VGISVEAAKRDVRLVLGLYTPPELRAKHGALLRFFVHACM